MTNPSGPGSMPAVRERTSIGRGSFNGGTAAGVASLATVALAPALGPWAPLAGAALGGFLSAVGTASRDRVKRDPTGFVGFLARLFAWVG